MTLESLILFVDMPLYYAYMKIYHFRPNFIYVYFMSCWSLLSMLHAILLRWVYIFFLFHDITSFRHYHAKSARIWLIHIIEAVGLHFQHGKFHFSRGYYFSKCKICYHKYFIIITTLDITCKYRYFILYFRNFLIWFYSLLFSLIRRK